MSSEKNYPVVDSAESFEALLEQVRQAQRVFAGYTQERVDAIFQAAAAAADRARIPLAKLAVEETGMGVVEDKVIKNNYASEHVHNYFRHKKTCGVISEDKAFGTKRIAEPVGIVGAVTPTTNPTSTCIFKILICLKTRNAILISPHPTAKRCTSEAARIMREAAEKAGLPEKLAEIGVKREDFDALAQSAYMDASTPDNPVEVSHEILKSIYEKMYE